MNRNSDVDRWFEEKARPMADALRRLLALADDLRAQGLAHMRHGPHGVGEIVDVEQRQCALLDQLVRTLALRGKYTPWNGKDLASLLGNLRELTRDERDQVARVRLLLSPMEDRAILPVVTPLFTLASPSSPRLIIPPERAASRI